MKPLTTLALMLVPAACAGGVVAVTNPGNGVRVIDGDTPD